jgi:CRP/FNR family transcriptional regulator, nitrogen oxide reductase regulator
MKVTALSVMMKDCVNCSCKLLPGKRVAGLPPALRPRFLSGLPKSALNAILSTATHRQFLASSVIIHEGDPAERFFILSSGQGRHFILTSEGRKILMHWLTPGQLFGGAALLSTPSHYLASTEVLFNSCALVWDRTTIRELLSRSPGLLDNVLSIAITENIAWLVAAQVSLSVDDATGRIAHMLVSLASGIGEAGPAGIEIRVGNDDLATGANVTPFTVSRTLAAWQREGVLSKARGKILLRKPERLVTR